MELVSNKLDHEEVAEKVQIVDVVVEPKLEAIEKLITAAKWIDG